MEDLMPLESTWIAILISGVIAILLIVDMVKSSLPAQNIIMIVLGLLIGEGVLCYYLIDFSQTDVEGSMLRYVGGAALLWLAVVLLARRSSQLILRPWRHEWAYGIWLICMSAAWTGGVQFAMPSFNPIPVDSNRAAMLALIRGVTTAIFLACLVPWLIQKRPRMRKRGPDLEVPQKAGSEFAQEPKNETQEDAQ